jgi:hypothetical protein
VIFVDPPHLRISKAQAVWTGRERHHEHDDARGQRAMAMAAAAKGAPAAVIAETIETTPLTDEVRERLTELIGGDADEG